MTKSFVLLCVAMFACAATPAARGETPVPSESRWNPNETAPTVDDVASAAAQARSTHCRTSSCKAIIVIHKLWLIEKYKMIDNDIEGPNGVVLFKPGNWPEIAARRLDHTLLDHPERYGSVCAMGAKLVSHVHPNGETFIPIMLLMRGVDMDLRDHGHCARDLAAALPRDPADDQIRIDARDLCIDADHRPKAACAVLIEGINESSSGRQP